jgi:hypothetical protein
MGEVFFTVADRIRAVLRTRRELLLEILALRHQLGVLSRSDRRFRLFDVLGVLATGVAAVGRGADVGPAGDSPPAWQFGDSPCAANSIDMAARLTRRARSARPRAFL